MVTDDAKMESFIKTVQRTLSYTVSAEVRGIKKSVNELGPVITEVK